MTSARHGLVLLASFLAPRKTLEPTPLGGFKTLAPCWGEHLVNAASVSGRRMGGLSRSEIPAWIRLRACHVLIGRMWSATLAFLT
jgi:hypothetical protein